MGSHKAKNSSEKPQNKNEEKKDINIQSPVSKTKNLKRQKREQSLILYWGNLFSILLLSYFNFFIFFFKDKKFVAIGGLVVSFVTSFTFIFGSCKLADTKKDLCALYFLIDSIFVSYVTAVVGLTNFILIVFDSNSDVNALSYIAIIIWNLIYYLFAGNSRVIVAYVKYKMWQTILLKITLILGLLAYLILAAYFMKNDFPGKGISEKTQQTIRDFFFLYIFGLFSLYMELFSKINDIDGSTNLQYHYVIDEEENYEQVPLKQTINESQITEPKEEEVQNNTTEERYQIKLFS